MRCPDCNRKIVMCHRNDLVLIDHPRFPGKHIDCKTHILPIWEWGSACQRGFVSDSRFGPNDQVIKRTNRETTRRWRALGV